MKINRMLLAAAIVGGQNFSVPAQECFDMRQEVMPLSIEDMFVLADENNSSIRSYDFATLAAAETVRTARSSRLPSLEISASASLLGDGWIADRDFTNGMNAPIPRFGNNFAVEAVQVIYAGGAVSAGIAMAELNFESLRAEAESNRQNIRFLLIGNYLELYRLDNHAEVYRNNIRQTECLLKEIQACHREGVAIRNDITRYELQLQRLGLALRQTENNREIINERLISALGLEEGVRIEPDRGIVNELPVMLAEAEWQTISEDAPQMRQARLGTEQALREVDMARSERMPKLSVFAGDHLDGPVTIEVPPLDKNFNYWYAGIGLRFDIASLYRAGSNVRRAKYVSQQAAAFERLAHENLHSEVKEAYIRLNEAFTNWEMQTKNLQLAQENYNVVSNRFLNDLALLTDMLDADSAKLSAELEVANARIGILFSYYSLRRAVGTL